MCLLQAFAYEGTANNWTNVIITSKDGITLLFLFIKINHRVTV